MLIRFQLVIVPDSPHKRLKRQHMSSISSMEEEQEGEEEHSSAGAGFYHGSPTDHVNAQSRWQPPDVRTVDTGNCHIQAYKKTCG